MIKFFRHIRQSLINQNKMGKYFKYAIGEIILVVIGILIALQINTWNEQRKINIEEGLYINRLIIENKEDLITFENEINNLKNGIATIESFSQAFKDVNTPDSVLVKTANDYFQYGSIYPTFSSSTSTFDDLSSTGNLKILSNTELRDKLVKHYALHEQVHERIRIGIEWALPVDGPFTYEHNIMQFEPSSTFLFPEKSLQDQASYLRIHKEDFINMAAAQYWLKKDAISQLELLKDESKIVIQLLESQ